MDWNSIISMLATITVPIIIALIAEIASIRRLDKHLGFDEKEASLKKQLEQKLGTSTKSIDEQLGISSKSISEQLGTTNKSISDQLGVGTDTPSLTIQHSEIKNALELQDGKITDIANLINENYTAVEKRLDKLKGHQKEIRNKISDISDVIEDWQRLVVKCEEQAELIEELNRTVAELTDRLEKADDNEELEP